MSDNHDLVVAQRLVRALLNDDEDGYGLTMAEVIHCEGCARRVIDALASWAGGMLMAAGVFISGHPTGTADFGALRARAVAEVQELLAYALDRLEAEDEREL